MQKLSDTCIDLVVKLGLVGVHHNIWGLDFYVAIIQVLVAVVQPRYQSPTCIRINLSMVTYPRKFLPCFCEDLSLNNNWVNNLDLCQIENFTIFTSLLQSFHLAPSKHDYTRVDPVVIQGKPTLEWDVQRCQDTCQRHLLWCKTWNERNFKGKFALP